MPQRKGSLHSLQKFAIGVSPLASVTRNDLGPDRKSKVYCEVAGRPDPGCYVTVTLRRMNASAAGTHGPSASPPA